VFAQTQKEIVEEHDMPGPVDLISVIARVNALQEFLDTEDGANLLVAYRRAANIVRIEEKKDGVRYEPALYDPQLSEGDERALRDALEDVSDKVEPLLKAEEFVEAMACLSRLRRPVDRFFEKVTVNATDPDLRRNRLRLLARLREKMGDVADFSQIEG